VCACLGWTSGLASQAQTSAALATSDTSPSAGVFRSVVDLVALNVVVTDRGEQFVRGLEQSDFVVMEDGIQQNVSFFATVDVPLDLALLLDTSASMAGQMDVVRETARGFVRAVRGIDRVMVLDIKQTTRLLHPLNGDVDGALQAIASTEAGGGTGLYNGLYLTLRELMASRHSDATRQVRRQAIAVLSDGHDTSSLLSFDDVMEIARDAGIATYTINLQSSIESTGRPVSVSRVLSHAEYSLKELARVTGAQAFFPVHVRELEGVYGRIATELSNQYALAYVPTKGRQHGEFRRITVNVSDHPELRTRTRSGYTSKRQG
jgi:VWFA-related protein